MAYTRKNLALDNEDDKDILEWLERQDNQTEAVRTAIRAYMDQDVITLRSVYEAIGRIEQIVDQARIVTDSQENIDGGGDDIQENPELAAALDNLGI